MLGQGRPEIGRSFPGSKLDVLVEKHGQPRLWIVAELGQTRTPPLALGLQEGDCEAERRFSVSKICRISDLLRLRSHCLLKTTFPNHCVFSKPVTPWKA